MACNISAEREDYIEAVDHLPVLTNLTTVQPVMPDLPPDDDELELEPIDPEILASKREWGEKKTDQAQSAVNEGLIRQAEEMDDPITLQDLKNFRFTTRHLLILTGLLALVMTFCQVWGFGLGMFVTALSVVAAGWYFTMMHERRHQVGVDQLRNELATQLEERVGKSVEGDRGKTSNDRSDQIEWDEGPAEFSFSFSLKEMFIVFSVAAVLLALVSLLGPGALSIVLGMIALGGLIAHAVGVEAPPVVLFGWWILLVLYLLLGLWHSISVDELASLRFLAVTASINVGDRLNRKTYNPKWL